MTMSEPTRGDEIDEAPSPSATAGDQVPATGADGADRNPLFPEDDASEYQNRWQLVQSTFVDDPATAVRNADALTDEVMERLRSDFDEHRLRDLDSDKGRGEDSTEDLRRAFQRYRSFFERLLQA